MSGYKGKAPNWARYSDSQVAQIDASIVEHPEWGSPAMARQLYCEQRGVDIGVASYMKQKAETEKRGVGSGLGPAQRMMELWFEPLVQVWPSLLLSMLLLWKCGWRRPPAIHRTPHLLLLLVLWLWILFVLFLLLSLFLRALPLALILANVLATTLLLSLSPLDKLSGEHRSRQ